MDMLGKSGGLSSAEELQAYLQQLQKGCTQLMVENEEVKTKAWLALRHAESESELGLGIIEAARRNAEDTHSVDMTKAAVEADHRKLADAKRIRNIYAHQSGQNASEERGRSDH
ncbi:hypothetical protein DIPPA_03534 [Diplonema papillatum]|nr:hypothetical protein DIPPA_03534 [Diplonema papillatum]